MAKYITVKTVAEFFGKSEKTIRRWIDEGKLDAVRDPGGRNWLIKEEDFDRLNKQIGGNA